MNDIFEETVNNGVNVEALLEARKALAQTPQAARFQWQVESGWIKGTHTQVKINKFFGLGDEQQHKTAYTFESDHPEVFASEDKGPTPVEYVLVGLAGCLSAGIAAIAQHREIKLNSVVARVTGDMDIQGILGIDEEVRNGFDNITVTFEIDADADRQEIEALVAQSQKRSAVFDALTNPTAVNVIVA